MENDKLVRLSDVIETVENQCIDGNIWGNENLTLIDASKTVDELSDIPAVDAVEVQHGRWIWDGYNYDYPWQCSKCGYFEGSQKNYCPHCGACMDEKEKYNAAD